MADKKTGSARRPSRDEDEAPKKKQSGTQKALKKGTSSRKAPSNDDDDDAPKPAKKGSARNQRGDSARSAGGPPRQAGPDKGKIFLYFVPGVILLLLGVGAWAAMLPDKPEKKDTVINFDDKISEAKQKYVQAKTAFQEGSSKEGSDGLGKMIDSYRLLIESHRIIQGVRNDLEALDKKKGSDPTVQVHEGQTMGDAKAPKSYQFDNDDQLVCEFKVTVRKAIMERPGGMEAVKPLVEQDQKDAAKDNNEDDLLK